MQIIDHHPLSRELARLDLQRRAAGRGDDALGRAVDRSRARVSTVEATLLLLGIYEDTGSLSYHATTPRDVRCVAWLLEQGARLDIADEFLHYPLTDDQRELYERLVEQHRDL